MSCFWCVAHAHQGTWGDLAGLCKFVGIIHGGLEATYSSSMPVAVGSMQRSVLRRRLNPYPAASLPSPDALFSTGLVVCVKFMSVERIHSYSFKALVIMQLDTYIQARVQFVLQISSPVLCIALCGFEVQRCAA